MIIRFLALFKAFSLMLTPFGESVRNMVSKLCLLHPQHLEPFEKKTPMPQALQTTTYQNWNDYILQVSG